MSTNGRVPDSDLVKVQASWIDGGAGIRLTGPTAAAWWSWRRAASSTGRVIALAYPAGGYRSRDVQADMHVHPGRYGLNAASSVTLAPVGASPHGLGRAIDIVHATTGRYDDALIRWLKATAGTYGFVQQFGDRDANHFLHDGRTVPAGTGTTPLDNDPEEDDEMKPYVIHRSEGGDEWSLCAPWITGASAIERGYCATTSSEIAKAWQRMHEKGMGTATAGNLTRADYMQIQAQARMEYAEWQRSNATPADADGIADELADRLRE